MYVHVDIKKIINKNKNIFEKVSEYVGFSPPPTYFLHTLLGLACLVYNSHWSQRIGRKYVGGGENPTYSLIVSKMFLFLSVL